MPTKEFDNVAVIFRLFEASMLTYVSSMSQPDWLAEGPRDVNECRGDYEESGDLERLGCYERSRQGDG